MQSLCCANAFYLYENKKKCYQINGFAVSLALKQRLEATRKWPIAHARNVTIPSFLFHIHFVMKVSDIKGRSAALPVHCHLVLCKTGKRSFFP